MYSTADSRMESSRITFNILRKEHSLSRFKALLKLAKGTHGSLEMKAAQLR